MKYLLILLTLTGCASAPSFNTNPATSLTEVTSANVSSDVILTSPLGSFKDGAKWNLDAAGYILRNNKNVAGVPYPNANWQTSTLVFHQGFVYAWGSDSQWYVYDSALGLLKLSGLAPITPNPQPYTPKPPPPPVPSAFTPPGKIVPAACTGNAATDAGVLQTAASNAQAGNTVQVSGNCALTNFSLTNGVYYYTPKASTLTATQITIPSSVTMNGFTVCGAKLFIENAANVTLGNNNFGTSTCQIDTMDINGTSALRLVNNSFTNMKSDGIMGYRPTGLMIDGNVFDGCTNDCINLPLGAGANSTIQRNVFLNTHKAVMEIGYAATTEATTNFQLLNNWSSQSLSPEKFSNGFGYQLAWSIPLNGVGSKGNVISGNYANGTTPDGNGDICIEISGIGTVQNNQCSNFDFGALGYGNCASTVQVFTNNNFSETKFGTTSSYNKCTGVAFQVSGTSTNHLAVPAQPKRVPWAG